MVGESFLAMACAGLIALLFGTILAFSGYRLFIILLPIWGFFFGLALGAQTIQVLFGDAFLATVTSWVVGFIVALLFAALSYMFYFFAVALISGALGYGITVGILTWIGLNFGVLVWIIGLVAGIALAIIVLVFNIQKWVVIAATSVLGAAVVVATIILLFNPSADVLANPIQSAWNTSPLLTLLFLVIAVLGLIFQIRSNRNYTISSYNRWVEAPVSEASS
jgi:hypothetical protein